MERRPLVLVNGILKELPLTDTLPGGGGTLNTFETVSKNLNSYPGTLNYTSGNLISIAYNTGTGTVTKTFNYTGGVLTSIVLSGDLPSGIALTKTLSYTNGILSGISYS